MTHNGILYRCTFGIKRDQTLTINRSVHEVMSERIESVDIGLLSAFGAGGGKNNTTLKY
jgi:hypothetical protein